MDLGRKKVQTPAVSTQVDVSVARAQEAQLVGVTAHRGTVHLFVVIHEETKRGNVRAGQGEENEQSGWGW